MTHPEEEFRNFFGRYAVVSVGPQPEKLADFYDNSFLAAGPRGGAAFNNDEAFLSWLREVRAFNQRAGMTAMAVAGVEVAPVSADYALVTVEWAATFKRLPDAPIHFRISYLLRQAEEGMKIAGYVSHEDQEESMRANGLL